MQPLNFGADNPAFSFTYDGEPFSAAAWQVEPTALGCIYRHADGLVVAAEYRRFAGSDAVEVLLRLTNEGSAPTAIVSDLLPVDQLLPLEEAAPANLFHARGSLCRMDDFESFVSALAPGQTLTLQPQGGRSSNGVLPFMNLQMPEGGIVLAVGWSGQWQVSLERQGAQLRLKVGMAQTHFRLQPGEQVRTPRVLLVPWSGDHSPNVGDNALRQLILKHYSPLDPDGHPCLPPLSHNTMMTYYQQGTTNDREMRHMLQRCAELGLEAFWIDACWYGTVGNSKAPEDGWWANAGNWFYNRQNFPQGLADIGESVAHEGMDFIVWFEPERVHETSLVGREHPEFVLRLPDNPMGLFDLGNPPALAYLTDLISGFISDGAITIYRQDFNMDPLPYWQAADAEDRQGIAEMKHIAGLYAFWDELRRRHPGLRIDNCSSGGRRIDLETISRSYPLWRSDFSDAGGPSYGLGLPIADQMASSGLSRWVPLHGGPVWSAAPYHWRSAMSTGVSLYGDIRGEGFPVDLTKQAIAEWRRLRPLMLGDYYCLTPLTVAAHDWCAYQFHDPAERRGFAVFFRRHISGFPTLETGLKGLEPDATYQVTMRPDYEAVEPQTMTGAELSNLIVNIKQQPGSLLVEYTTTLR
jgi:alpha-galactosidase